MSIYEKEFFSPFSETPPFAFIKGTAEQIRAERENLLLRLGELEKKRESVLGRIMGEPEADVAERRQIAAKQYKLISCLQDAMYTEDAALERREIFLKKTGIVYAECICFAEGYAVYLDDDGMLSVGEIDEEICVGDVRSKAARLCPISELSKEERENITRTVTDLPFEWCEKAKVKRSFGL